MKRTELYVSIIILLLVAVICRQMQQNRKLVTLALAASRPVYLGPQAVTLSISPTSTTHIEKVEGNGHTIGNENRVENTGV